MGDGQSRSRPSRARDGRREGEVALAHWHQPGEPASEQASFRRRERIPLRNQYEMRASADSKMKMRLIFGRLTR